MGLKLFLKEAYLFTHVVYETNAVNAKGGFFTESAIWFLHLQISKKNIPKNYPELKI